MSISVTFNKAHRIVLASEFFMARRPVLDDDHALVAHDLLFCQPADDAARAPDGVEDVPASASVIADVYQHGVGRVLGELQGFLHVDSDALASDIFQFLPPQKIVLTVDESVVGAGMEVRIAELAQAGYGFALEIASDSPTIQRLLPLVGTVRIDIAGRSAQDLNNLCAAFKSQGKKLLAEQVVSAEQFRLCRDCGFDYFQGYFFAQPHIVPGRSLSPSQLAITELMALVASDADTAEIENAIKGDVSLGLNLLRLANTPAFSAHRIDSLRQALMVLGRNQLQRWLQILLYAEPGTHGRAMLPLLSQAATRGRLLELVAQKTRPGNRGLADTAFTVGIMSLMDALFGIAMEDILKQIAVIDEVADALLERKGYFGELLRFAEYTEWADKRHTLLLQAIREQRLSFAELYALQLAAFEWSDHVAHNMR